MEEELPKAKSVDKRGVNIGIGGIKKIVGSAD